MYTQIFFADKGDTPFDAEWWGGGVRGGGGVQTPPPSAEKKLDIGRPLLWINSPTTVTIYLTIYYNREFKEKVIGHFEFHPYDYLNYKTTQTMRYVPSNY